MKKLLAAVTSIAMSTSLVTSAFASSITVSAAGGSSAVQPNASMGGVMDGAVNKIAGESDSFPVNENFIISGSEYTAKPGDTVEVEFFVSNPEGRLGNLFVAQLDDLPAGITAEMEDTFCYAVPNDREYSAIGDTFQAKVIDPATADPVEIIDGESIICFTLTIPEDIEPGEYNYSLKQFDVVEFAQKNDEHDISKFAAKLLPGTIIIEGESSNTTKPAETTTQTTASSATTAKPESSTTASTSKNDNLSEFDVNPNFVITGQDYEVEPGDTVEIEFLVSNPEGRLGNLFVAKLADLPAGITAEMEDTFCYAVPNDREYAAVGETYQAKVIDPATADPVEIIDGESIICFTFTIPEDIEPGSYSYSLSQFDVVEYAQKNDDHDISKFAATLKPGTITVKGESSGTTTKQTELTTTTSSESSTTTATQKVDPAEGSAEWLIPTVHAKPGDDVTMEVIVNGASDLAVAGASYTVTADSPIEFSGVSGQSTAYSSAIVNNPATNEFAFGESKGAGIVGSDQAVIMTLTYHVPEGTAGGTYPVKWSSEFVSDTNGLEITKNVTFTDGAIIIDDETFDGEIVWDIPDKVKAKPGETVTMEVVVKDTDGAALPVAGAQFAIEAKTPIEFSGVSGESAGYKASIVNNPATNEFAFGEGKGAGVSANNGDNVLVLTYTVPAGTAAGEYPVTWGGDIYISDTNGNPLTEQITLSDGSILVEDDKFEGELAWEIPVVHAKPGETVTMEVAVKDPDGAGLPVAGAQFAIEAKTPIEFSAVSGESAGYKASIVNNPATNEFAFGEGKGAGISANNGDNVLVLTYTVPAGTPAGEYPVTWGGDVYISDTNGNPLTEQISLIDGAIIIDDETVDGDITWTIPEVEAQPGETVSMDVLVTVGDKNLPVAGAQFEISAAQPIGFSAVSGESAGYKASIVNNSATNEFAFAEAKGAGVEAANNSVVLTLTYTVPDDIEPGRYPVDWANAFISDTNGNEITSSVKLVDGAIIIPEKTTTTTEATTTEATTTKATTTTAATTTKATTTEATTTEATTTEATTTKATTTTSATTTEATTTTTVTAPEGKILWQIDTVEAAPGDEVTLNVVVNDSNGANLPIGGAQYIITETTPIEFVSASDKSEGYGADIVYNANTKEFAFANAKGDGVAAADGAVVMTLTYKVPEDCEDGTYPVTFGDDSFFNISSADGIDMSSQILTIDGAIIVKRPATTTTEATTTSTTTEATTTATTTTEATTTTTVTPADGSVIWQGETVVAHPGEKVELSFIVSDPKDTKLPLGGANFVITADGEIKLVEGAGSEGYGADIVYNAERGEFAFAHEKGTGVAAPDGSKVVTLTFEVPADIEPGKYPVTLSELFASDTNGFDITKNILVVNGAIVIEELTTTASTTTATTTTTTAATTTEATTTTATTPAPDGAVIWQLDEAEGVPGQTVTLTMTVLDPNKTALEIGGGQFVIVTDPDLVAAAGTPYGAVLVYNPETNEFAFADAKGAGVASTDGEVMMTIDFTIPEDAVPGTVYDVEISNIFASNGNGQDVSKNVFGMNGKIKVIAPETTTTEATTTTAATTTEGSTTTVATTTEGSTTTAATTTEGSTTTVATTTEGSTTTVATTTEGSTTTVA
ncbi:MAG: cohesin domain-containing protein, partial [Ruminococcus flavefaciens]|nr:cohesin domain-containing protein [Ruminococcus flavefaciens]